MVHRRDVSAESSTSTSAQPDSRPHRKRRAAQARRVGRERHLQQRSRPGCRPRRSAVTICRRPLPECPNPHAERCASTRARGFRTLQVTRRLASTRPIATTASQRRVRFAPAIRRSFMKTLLAWQSQRPWRYRCFNFRDAPSGCQMDNLARSPAGQRSQKVQLIVRCCLTRALAGQPRECRPETCSYGRGDIDV
jgi:hypothetical protein